MSFGGIFHFFNLVKPFKHPPLGVVSKTTSKYMLETLPKGICNAGKYCRWLAEKK